MLSHLLAPPAPTPEDPRPPRRCVAPPLSALPLALERAAPDRFRRGRRGLLIARSALLGERHLQLSNPDSHPELLRLLAYAAADHRLLWRLEEDPRGPVARLLDAQGRTRAALQLQGARCDLTGQVLALALAFLEVRGELDALTEATPGYPTAL
ncbi:hypothetical protein HNR42_003588 [Deinobacterium chartae]|uniref:Uncharacterized protein n=1 Tax=Deinobacterium chartae TaxID=521158 RepID=A0A841I8H6_9DEIO|nr:hypothetical protein [Deinobacterium chartae]MBB6100122.1 hypothetical protein [Deinobacterium chartae]